MNILFVLGAYNPEPSANGICVDAVIKSMAARGDNIYCIANRLPGYKDYEMIDGVRIYRVGIQKYQYLEIKARKSRNAIVKKAYQILSLVLDVWRLVTQKKDFPVMGQKRVKLIYSKARELIENEEIYTIVAVNMPIEAIDATYRIQTEYPDIRTVAYLLDPIAGGLKHRWIDDAAAESKCLRYEKKVLSSFDSVVVQKEHQVHFEKTFTEDELKKFSFLGVPLLKDRTEMQGESGGKGFTAIYAGGISTKYRDPTFIIEAFKHLPDAKLVMYITGDRQAAINAAGDAENIEINGRIEHSELEKEMAKADCFVNIGNNQTMQSPSKLVEYMGYGKPIISTFRIDGDTSEYYMHHYASSLYLDERSMDYSEAAARIAHFLKSAPRCLSYPEIERNFSEYTVEAFIKAAF